MRYVISILLVGILLSGCLGEEKPENLLTEDSYVDLLVELELLRTYQSTVSADSVTIDSLKNEIYDNYETTESQFQKSHSYYQQDLDGQSERVKEALERLKKNGIVQDDTTAVNDSINTQ